VERLSSDEEEAMKLARIASLAAVAALVLGACGKSGGTTPLAGVYHLKGGSDATSLELRADGTFTLRRDSCESSGVLTCGDWTPGPTGAQVRAVPGLYWPTPDSFPSAVVRRISLSSLGGDLIVVGESDWAGTFTERWAPGRSCAVCTERHSSAGATYVLSSAKACAEPMPACARM
jgi:hypothetical protein